MSRHRVVIIGSGFGGLFAAKALKRADVDVTLIAKTTHHLFQPLLYQVATGILSEGEIAPATREILRRQKQRHGAARRGRRTSTSTHRTVTSRFHDQYSETPYDSLIVAAGAGQSYFGNDQFADVRARHEVHRRRPRAARPHLRRLRAGRVHRRRGGATAAADLRRRRRRPDRRRDGRPDPRAGHLDAAQRVPQHRPDHGAGDPASTAPPQVLPPFGAEAGRQGAEDARAARASRCSSTPWSPTSTRTASTVKHEDGTQERIESVAQGVGRRRAGQRAGRTLAEQSGAELDRAGRVVVGRRPHPARAPRGVRRRRHDVRGRRAGRGAGRDPGRAVRRRPRSARGSSTRRTREPSSTTTRAPWPPSPSSRRWR